MLCPFCREKDTSVVDSRPTEDGTAIRRRRFCNCNGGQRFTTFERVQFRELTVIKKNGRKSQFDREKLAKSFVLPQPLTWAFFNPFFNNLMNFNHGINIIFLIFKGIYGRMKNYFKVIIIF